MSGATEGQRDAAQVQAASAQHQLDLFNIGAPGVRLALGDFVKDLGTAGQGSAAVDELYSGLQKTNKSEFDAAEDSSTSTISQMAKQSGFRGATGGVESIASNTLADLESARRTNARALTQQKTDAEIQQRDFNLSQILGIGTGMGGQSNQSYQNALGIANTFNNSNPWGSAASGAASGAAAGSVAGPWGTVIGGIVGGAAGYFG